MVTLYFIYMDNECVLIEFEQNETNNTETLYKMYIAYSVLIKLVQTKNKSVIYVYIVPIKCDLSICKLLSSCDQYTYRQYPKSLKE